LRTELQREHTIGRIGAVLVTALLGPLSSLAAQQWNDPRALDMVRRGAQVRQQAQVDSSLISYRALAHGFVFFLAQLGEGLNEPPRLVKADQLDVEVYWKAPNLSKQIVLGWRDGTWLPTDINYHRDHLGIVTNNFGDLIRIGEGDEVRDVVHPISPAGLERYDFSLQDSIEVRAPEGTITLYEIAVRPRDFQSPLVVGTVYLDAASAALVRFRFSFTPPAYLDQQLEDISIVLENSLWEGRYWLPFRQEVEIRRRTTWLDFPARGIIRGRWEIGGYEFNSDLPAALFQGAPIAGLRTPRNDDSTRFAGPLDSAVAAVAEPLNRQDMEALRVEVERIAGTRALGGLASRRLAARSLSDVIKVNRVQGLTLGFGATLGSSESRFQARPYLAYGTSDQRLLGSLMLSLNSGPSRLSLEGYRRIRDLSDLPIITPIFNSLAAQEFGKDYGDYVLLDGGALGIRHRASSRATLGLDFYYEQPASVVTEAEPASGRYRPNPPLGGEEFGGIRVRADQASGGFGLAHDFHGTASLEVADGSFRYVRVTLEPHWLTRLAGQELTLSGYFGWGSDQLPAYRSFVLGGRNTLPGEPFRAYGGKSIALARAEWRFEAAFPALPLGSHASTGRTIVVAPFIAAGWTERSLAGTPWRTTDGIRPVGGVALEWFHRLVRLEAGIGLRAGDIGVSLEIQRDWWGIL
jgi:hypothetical protein